MLIKCLVYMMVVARCVKCGKKYELESNEKLSDFQCECGGELSSNGVALEFLEPKKPKNEPKSWDEQTTGAKVGGIIILLCIGLIVIVGISAVFSPNKTTASGNSVFQNQYISFEYPKGFEVTEITGSSDSSIKIMDILIKKDGKLIGEVIYYENQPVDLTNMKNDPNTRKSTIAGKNALETSDASGLYGDIILGTSSTGFNKFIDFQTDTTYPDLYNTIKNTIVIKKLPPDT